MDSATEPFESWLRKGWERFQELVRADPAKYKVTNRRGPQFPNFLVTPSRDPDLYPNELRCRLATQRQGTEATEAVCTAVLECKGERIDPSTVWSGAFMTPIFKLGYYKNGDDFGLQLTVLKGEYEMIAPREVIQNDAWQMDSDAETANASGSASVSSEGSMMG